MIFYLEKIFCGVWVDFGRIVLYVFEGFLVVCVCCVQVEEEGKKHLCEVKKKRKKN